MLEYSHWDRTLRFCHEDADLLHMPEVQDDRLVIDANEEKYLRSVFRRFALPYVIGIVVLVLGLWLLSTLGEPRPAGAGTTMDGAELVSLRAELDELRAQLERVDANARQATRAAEAAAERSARPSAPATTPALGDTPEWRSLLARLDRVGGRIDGLEARPPQKIERVERVVSQPIAAPGDEVTRDLLERMYNIEARQEQQEAGIHEGQKSLLDRVFAIEKSRDAAVVERTALEKSILERMQNVEDRFYALEQSRRASTPAARTP